MLSIRIAPFSKRDLENLRILLFTKPLHYKNEISVRLLHISLDKIVNVFCKVGVWRTSAVGGALVVLKVEG